MSNTRTTTSRSRVRPKAAPADSGPAYLHVFGDKYRVAEKVGIWPLMQFARAAESGTTLADHRGLAACHAFLQDVIDPLDWGRFQEDMITKKVNDLDALMTAARQAIDELVKRQGNGDGPPAGGAAGGGKPAVRGEVEGGEAAARDRIRASDTDRDQVLERLAAAAADGRLTGEEHEQRVGQAAAARTLGDLRVLTGDLPGPADAA